MAPNGIGLGIPTPALCIYRANTTWEDSRIKKGKTKEKPNRAGIHTVGDVKALTLQRVKALTVKGSAEKIAGISIAGLQKFVDDARTKNPAKKRRSQISCLGN